MLLGHSHTLSTGRRVRLRLAHVTDLADVLDLAARAGSPCGELEARRLVRFSPRSRVTVCARAWLDRRNVLVGYASGELDTGRPDVVLVDEAAAPGLGGLLAEAIAERAGGHQRSVA